MAIKGNYELATYCCYGAFGVDVVVVAVLRDYCYLLHCYGAEMLLRKFIIVFLRSR